MGTIVGNYVATFSEGDAALETAIHLNDDYEVTYDIVEVTPHTVTLRGHKTGKELMCWIGMKPNGREYVEVTHRGLLAEMLGPEIITVVPFTKARPKE